MNTPDLNSIVADQAAHQLIKERHVCLIFAGACITVARVIGMMGGAEESTSASLHPDVKMELILGLRTYFYVAAGIGIAIAISDWWRDQRNRRAVKSEIPKPSHAPEPGPGSSEM